MSSNDAQGMAPLAELRGASKRYGATMALEGLDFRVGRGEIVALLGPNGAGKTTALGLLNGRLSADSGRVSLLGGDPRDWRVRQRLGVMLQEARLPDQLRVGEYLQLFASHYPEPRPIDEVLALTGLEALVSRRHDALSGGEQRRLQFALAIIGRPALLLVDEPTVGLDIEARQRFWQLIRRLRGEGLAMVLTTHYLDEADALADRIVVIGSGRVLAEGTPAGIKARAAGKRLRFRSALPLAEIAALSGLDAVKMEQGVVEARSHAPEAALRQLLMRDPQLAELEVLPLKLDDAFLVLTADAARHKEAA
ncbi:ABC transporter ATP-binding protein [Pseudomarimonas salicorniae]|uniref:ABC transporter ATP-binding protein n=1 Tax=Pseudomarimonas salicorniae TaxID=2933270 RepID=A0ABT0GGR8_9GAMM|nr:ABC transporter ATP-binding protein [Lysobacter sp. CAU 1642]MCK7593552.1 ABC transporter ATP-binding protein [Lysobacter sp. CAU 1642]